MLNQCVGQLTTQRPSRCAGDTACALGHTPRFLLRRRVSVLTTFLLASEPESAVFRHDAKLLDPRT